MLLFVLFQLLCQRQVQEKHVWRVQFLLHPKTVDQLGQKYHEAQESSALTQFPCSGIESLALKTMQPLLHPMESLVFDNEFLSHSNCLFANLFAGVVQPSPALYLLLQRFHMKNQLVHEIEES